MDADSDVFLGEIVDGVLDPSLVTSGNYAISVEYIPGGEESLRLQLGDGPVQTESSEPYALFGDNRGDFFGQPLPTDPFALTLQAFAQNGGQGALLDEETIQITVLDDGLL